MSFAKAYHYHQKAMGQLPEQKQASLERMKSIKLETNKMELRIKKATHIIQRSFYPWIDREDVEEIVKEIESDPDTSKLNSKEIVSLICDICKDV